MKKTKKKAASTQEENLFQKIGGFAGEIAGKISNQKDRLVGMADNAIESVKTVVTEITQNKKPAAKKATKAPAKKPAKKAATKAAPASQPKKAAPVKKQATAKKTAAANRNSAAKKATPAKKSVTAKKAAPPKKGKNAAAKNVKSATKKTAKKK